MTNEEIYLKYRSINRSNILLKWIIGIGLIVGLWLWYQSCHPTPVEKPTTTTVKTQSETVKIDTLIEKHLRDSFASVLKQHYKKDYDNESQFIKLVNENEELVKINLQLQKPIVQDTCKELDLFWNKKYTTYTTQTQKALTAARNSINGLNQTVSVQKKAMDTKDGLYRKLKGDIDTCLKYAAINEKYIKKVKPKREINAGITGMAAYAGQTNLGGGVTLGYRNKTGMDISAAVYSNKIVTVTIKRSLFKF